MQSKITKRILPISSSVALIASIITMIIISALPAPDDGYFYHSEYKDFIVSVKKTGSIKSLMFTSNGALVNHKDYYELSAPVVTQLTAIDAHGVFTSSLILTLSDQVSFGVLEVPKALKDNLGLWASLITTSVFSTMMLLYALKHNKKDTST